jgi:uncharacterized repeat protein (TIGR04076 family)
VADKIGTAVRVEIMEIMGCGKCPSGFEVGRTWIVSDGLCPEGMCAWAFNAILPSITTLRFDGRFPWREEPLARVCCPDADNPVVFQLTPESK